MGQSSNNFQVGKKERSRTARLEDEKLRERREDSHKEGV